MVCFWVCRHTVCFNLGLISPENLFSSVFCTLVKLGLLMTSFLSLSAVLPESSASLIASLFSCLPVKVALQVLIALQASARDMAPQTNPALDFSKSFSLTCLLGSLVLNTNTARPLKAVGSPTYLSGLRKKYWHTLSWIPNESTEILTCNTHSKLAPMALYHCKIRAFLTHQCSRGNVPPCLQPQHVPCLPHGLLHSRTKLHTMQKKFYFNLSCKCIYL